MHTLHIIPQRAEGDCAVACLAMLTGVKYNDVLGKFHSNVSAHGASNYEIRGVAAILGHPLQWRTKYIDLDADTGMLEVEADEWEANHMVILKDEQIYDPEDSTLWDADVFMSVNKATVIGIFTLREAK